MTHKGYEYLEHTADVKIRAYGLTLSQAFENMAKATTGVMTDVDLVKQHVNKRINIASENTERLLYDFLDEIIYLMDTEEFLTAKAIVNIHGNSLSADLKGDYQNENQYEVHTYIKSVTLNELKVMKKENLHILQIIHDI